MTFFKFGASESTTSEDLTNKFEDVKSKFNEQNRDKTSTIILAIDEVGLAELAPDNPLKVLHKYLGYV